MRPLPKSLGLVVVLIATDLLAQNKLPSLENSINQLADTKQAGFGYSGTVSGSQFLPREDSGEWSMDLVGGRSPAPSTPMAAIVEQGAKAIPLLIAHLDDRRPTKIKPLSALMWTAANDEYDYNQRTRHDAPTGVNRDSFGDGNAPSSHQVTVGDLCFVALGQIVNRDFSAARYQPTGGLVINSPTSSPRLLAVIREDYGTLTAAKHQEQLIQDFKRPDSESRRNGAVMRIAYYYPDQLETLVVAQLKVSTFDVFGVEDFVRNVIYPQTSSEKRRQLLAEYLVAHGPAAKDGILLELFEDLDQQIADDEHRLTPPLNGKYDARNALVQLYNYTPQVKASDKPYINTWSEVERARFIEAVGPTSNSSINDEIYRIFSGIKDDDGLAVACIKVLKGKGHDDALVAYCKRRVDLSEGEKKELQQLLKSLSRRKQSSFRAKKRDRHKANPSFPVTTAP